MPRGSQIWQINLFRKINKDEAECIECSKNVKCSGGNTTNLINHLNNIHKNSNYATRYSELLVAKEGEKGAMEKHINITGSGQHIHFYFCYSLFNIANSQEDSHHMTKK
jgi:hypothetical protein